MHEAERQDGHVSEPLDEFEVELSDLPPSASSHYLLLRLNALKANLRESRQTFFRSDKVAPQHTALSSSPNDEDEIEISDLPPSTRSHYWLIALRSYLLTSTRRFVHGPGASSPRQAKRSARGWRPTRARVGQLLTTFGICAALLILLLGNDPALPNQLSALVHPSSTPSTTTGNAIVYTSVQIVNVNPPGATTIDSQGKHGALGSLPATCPQADAVQQFPTAFDSPPPGIGTRQVWVTGFSGPIAALRNLMPTPSTLQMPEGGRLQRLQWYTTLDVFIQKGYNEHFSLQGNDQLSGVSLQFGDINMSDATTGYFLFGLQNSTTQPLLIDDGQWDILQVNVYLPSSGCFFLQLDWSSGSWTGYFAAGR